MSRKNLIVITLLGVIVSLYSCFAFLYGFYNPFYPTSCIVPNEAHESNAAVVQHSRVYASHYPLSLIFNTIMHIILNIDCFKLGIIPFLPLLHLLLFNVLVSIYFKSDKQRIILLLLYSCVLIGYLYVVFPPYYFTIGNTGYIIFLYTLLFFNRKRGGNGILAEDYIALLLLFLLSAFSYYTSGFTSTITIMMATILDLIQEKLRRERVFEDRKFFYVGSKTLMVYLTLILSSIYIYFDYMFLQNLRYVINSEYLYEIITILARRKIEPGDALAYNPPTPPFFFLALARISMYLVLILSIAFIIVTLMKLIRSKAPLEWVIVASSLLSSFLISLHYSFLMNAIYIRSYLYFQVFLIPLLIFSTRENIHKVNIVLFLTYGTLILLSLSTMYNTAYSLLNPDALSDYTNYLSEEEYPAICNFISSSKLSYNVMADLKTAFSIPVRCNDKDLDVGVFKHQFFLYFNASHNVIMNVTRGTYFYATKYMQTPIFMLFWVLYKPFVVSYASFDGVIYNSGSTTLWIKLD